MTPVSSSSPTAGTLAAPRRTTSCERILDSVNTAPIGKSASDDWERYSNPSTDALFATYASTTSTAVQHTVIDELQKVMLS